MDTKVVEAVEFGESVRRYRDRHGWTRPDMVLRLRQVDPEHDWTVQKLTNVERGAVRHPPIRLIRILSIVLGCEVGDLVWPEPADPSRRTTWFADSASDQRVYPFPVRAGRTECQAA